jgi:antirestriction protein ArdC
MNNIYQIVTDKIIEKLEQGTIPWQKTWKTEVPRNFVTNNPYRGINTLLLGLQDFNSHYWLTFKQVKELSGWVKKGSTSTMVVFWKPVVLRPENISEDTDSDTYFLLRYYNVFNLEQVELPDEILNKRECNPTNSKILNAENIISGYPTPPAIVTNSTIPNPRYLPRIDRIEIQPIGNFHSSDNYYASLYHELIHSTGSANRLNRKGIVDTIKFGTEQYGKEELIAEVGASFLCSMSGIENTIDNQSSYIQNWLQVLQNDKRLILIAASQAQKAVDWILNIKQNNNEEETL